MAASAGPITVLLYGKPDCHLCDHAAAILTEVSRDAPISWRKVDIEGDPALFEQYRYRIPVIQVVGGQTLDWPTTAGRLREALQAAAEA